MEKKLQDKLIQIVGKRNIVARENVPQSNWKTHQPFLGKALIKTSSTEEVAGILKLCNDLNQAVVPISGITNMVKGCLTTSGDIGLSLENMNQIEEIDPIARTLTAQAGVTLREAQKVANENDMFFPVDIGARDTCMLGGNVSTNAGGTKVIRYGMIRDSVLGLEAVLADGTIVSSMNRFIKNNSGFDLKHLFIGSEGLLGVITRIVFRLSVKPKSHNVALLAAKTYDNVLTILNRVQNMIGSDLCGFEVMWGNFYDKVAELKEINLPLPEGYPIYMIVESMGNNPNVDNKLFEEMLLKLFDEDCVQDGVLAKSEKERSNIWAIREEIEWVISGTGNFDISLSVRDVDNYLHELNALIGQNFPDAYMAAFGHLGDNNIHISVSFEEKDVKQKKLIEKYVYETLIPYKGAISAEHGIGMEKREWLSVSRTPEEINLMKELKKMMDPNNILNPGKVFARNE